MKAAKMIWAGLLILALTAVAAPSFAANGTATANAALVDAIEISSSRNLNFGSILAGTPGTVILSAENAPVITGTVTAIAGPAQSTAKFTVAGTNASTFSIALDPSVTIKIGESADPTEQMVVNLANDLGTTGTLVAGSKDIYVGGTLNVGDDDAVGVYAGTFNVAVEYN